MSGSGGQDQQRGGGAGECRKARSRPIPFNCKAGAGHEGNCTPYTLPPSGNYLDRWKPEERPEPAP